MEYEQNKAIVNFSPINAFGHAILLTKKIDYMQEYEKHVIHGYPRDYPKKAKNYKNKLKTAIPLSIAKGYLLENTSLSEYMPVIIALPNNPKDIPRGLHPVVKFGIEMMIMRIHSQIKTEEMLWSGIQDRDEILKKVLTLDFNPLIKRFAKTMVEEDVKKLSSRTDTTAPTTNEEKGK